MESVSEGFIAWIYITLIPAIIIEVSGYYLTTNASQAMHLLFIIAQIMTGGYLIFRFQLPKKLIILTFLIPGFINLYFLIYGNFNNAKQSYKRTSYDQ